MPSYHASRKNHWPQILRQWSVPAAIYASILLLDKLLPDATIKIPSLFYWIGAVLLLMWWVDGISEPRVKTIQIDENNRTITQSYESPFTGEGEKIFTLTKTQLYIKLDTSATAAEILPTYLVLYKDHRRIIRVGVQKDGFTPQTLQAIRQDLENLGIAITEKE